MMDPADKAASFAATAAIRSGKWDDVLVVLGLEIGRRMASAEFKAAVLTRAEFRAGGA